MPACCPSCCRFACGTGFQPTGQWPPGEGEITVPAAPINAALTALVSLEALALRVVNMPIGTSLMCLAQKPG